MYQPLGIFRHDGQKKKKPKTKNKEKGKGKKKSLWLFTDRPEKVSESLRVLLQSTRIFLGVNSLDIIPY